MSEIQWRSVNYEPYEYAIQQGPHGDEFVKLLDGTCLRRSPFGGFGGLYGYRLFRKQRL